jgi:hypothetical protein
VSLPNGEDQNTDSQRKFQVSQGIEYFGSSHGVDHTPPDAGKNVDKGEEATRDETESITRKSHASQPSLGTKGNEKSGSKRSDDIEEEDSQETIPPSKSKGTWSKCSESKRRHACITGSEEKEQI